MNSQTAENGLIGALPADDRHAILGQCSQFEFRQAHVFHEAGDPIDHIHFVEQGVVSSVAMLSAIPWRSS